jgi:glycerophosphoryl diester phosphodiesterase
MCGVKKKLKDLTLAEVKKLKVSGVENIPTYAEVLDFVGRKVLLDIEIKEKGMEEMVVEELKKRKLVNNVIISSFNSKILARIKYLEPRIETFYLFHRKPLNFSKRLLDWSRKYGFKVLVWTVNSRKRIIKYKKWGVDGIITDFPDRV